MQSAQQQPPSLVFGIALLLPTAVLSPEGLPFPPGKTPYFVCQAWFSLFQTFLGSLSTDPWGPWGCLDPQLHLL